MKIILTVFFVCALFTILDLLWFQVAGNFFKSQIGSIARIDASGSWAILYVPAILAYILMTIGVLLFVLPVATTTLHAFILGALFGLISYGLYDMTNLATLTAWTTRFAIVDITWGTFLCGVVSASAYALRLLPFFAAK